jgi:two-component system OmpR family response regulator
VAVAPVPASVAGASVREAAEQVAVAQVQVELAEVAQVERREAMPVASSLSNLSVGNTGAMSGDARPEARLLVVDDEPNIVELLSASLRYAGFEVATAGGGQQALEVARAFRPDLLVLDVMMPGLDGFGVVSRLRGEGQRMPVVFLTARDATEDKVNGLTLGGDDYITKPFSLEEVIARIRAVLRRVTSPDHGAGSARLTFADIEMDDETHEVWKAGELVPLSPTEFKLLRYFMQNVNRVLSKAQILDHVWNYDFGGDMNVVESYVSYLRRKVDTSEPRLLHTLRGVGYVLRLPRT